MYMFTSFVTRLCALLGILKKYPSLISIYISKSALLHNYNVFTSHHPGIRVAPVLKSNAYGHGLNLVASVLQDTDAPFFVVDSLYEARLLKKHTIKKQILVIGYTHPEAIAEASSNNIVCTITSLAGLRTLCELKPKKLSIHLKIDTGMHRQGVLPTELEECMALIEAHSNLTLSGICTHFADADSSDTLNTEAQISTWNKVVEILQKKFPRITHVHIGGTAGFHFTQKATCTVLRVGLGMYGINPSPHQNLDLKPALAFHTIISGVKEIPAGAHVGYSYTYTADKPMRIATIPVGYYEGLDRRLSNCGSVLVLGIPCPIIGRVSMNITSIDVSHIPHCAPGTDVVVISSNPKDQNSIVQIAQNTGTIPYEMFVHIPTQLKRVLME